MTFLDADQASALGSRAKRGRRSSRALLALTLTSGALLALSSSCGGRSSVYDDYDLTRSPSRSEPEGCSSDSECTTDLAVCSPLGVCVQCVGSGLDNRGCSEGQLCQSGVCRESCNTALDCPSNELCDLETGSCTECFSDQNCDLGEFCQQGVCEPNCTLDSDCSFGQACLEGRCEGLSPLDCVPGEMRCFGAEVHTCDETGKGWTTTEFCSPEESCVGQGASSRCEDRICTPGESRCASPSIELLCDETGTVLRDMTCASGTRCLEDSCAPIAQICEPSQAVCDGNRATRCTNDGSAYEEGGVDCGGNACVEGRCQVRICVPGAQRCSGQDIRRCQDDGLSEMVVETCAGHEFCDPQAPSCHSQVCEPNAPICDGNSATFCDLLGSGPRGGGVDCESKICRDGVCEEAIIGDHFEDGDSEGWTIQGNGYSQEVTDDSAAEGSKYSLTMSGGNSSHYDGMFQTYAAFQPDSLSYWARHDGPGFGTYLTLHDATTDLTPDNEVAFVYFSDTDTILAGRLNGGAFVSDYDAGTWVHIQLFFDWDNSTYDIMVGGQMRSTNLSFRGDANVDAVRRISLYHYTPGSTGAWDQIEFR